MRVYNLIKQDFSLSLNLERNLNSLNNAINEIRSRSGKIVGIFHEKQDNFDLFIKTPKLNQTSSIFNIIPLQLLSYYLSDMLGNNVDKPRNIAKSVTVK